jgi:uncharacterized repeat protein (TIGR01451 family)
MMNKRLLQVLILWGLTLTSLALTMALPGLVQAQEPSIDLRKGPNTRTVDRGDNANFNFQVENTGSVTLTNVVVTDPLVPACDRNFASMGPDVIQSFSCTVNNVPESFVNIASVTAEAVAPFTGTQVTDSDAAQVLVSEDINMCPIDASIDMIAYWHLDEATPGSPIDYHDFYGGHDGNFCINSNSNNCPTSTIGRVKGAQSFDGNNDRIDVSIPDVTGFDFGQNDSFSIELWMKGVPGQTCANFGGGNDDNDVMIGRDDENTNLHWWLGCLGSTGQAHFRLQDINGNPNDQSNNLTSPAAINDGNWHHIVAVRDASVSTNRLYIDGAQVASQGGVNYTAGFGSTTAALNIGGLDLGGDRFDYTGTLDEIAIYEGALPPPLVTAHYNNGLGKYSPNYCTLDYRPTILSNPVKKGVVNEVYNYQVNAIGQPAPSYLIDVTPDDGLTIDSSGLISWTPTITQQYTVTVTATNSEGDDNQVYDLEISDFLSNYLPLVVKDAN